MKTYMKTDRAAFKTYIDLLLALYYKLLQLAISVAAV